MTALPFAYNASADCPQWEGFLGQVLTPENIFVLQEWFGYCLTAGVEFHKILAILGPMRSGKGTIADILCELLGPANVAALAASKWNRDNFSLESTLDKRLIRVSDAREDEDRSFSGAVVEDLLTISGGDPVRINIKHRGAVQRHPHGAKIIWTSNGMPRFNDPTGVIAERFMPIYTTTSFAGREDVELRKRLMVELPGILNWSLAGLDRLNQAGRFMTTAGTEAAKQAMRRAASTIVEFIEDCYALDPDSFVEKGEVFDRYRTWCGEAGHRGMSRNVFFQRLKEAYHQLDLEARPRNPALNPDRRRMIRGLRSQ